MERERERESEKQKGRVCVTGGTGYLASWMIKALLEHGYSVNTTVRSYKEKSRDVSFLTSLLGASKHLQIFQADLNEPDSFYAAVEGCNGVIHMASPVDIEESEPEERVSQTTINGTLGILQACLDSKTVKRVIYTSSASAVVHNGQNVEVMDECFWSDVEYARANKPFGVSYTNSKTLTEKAVLEFAEKNGLSVATVNPSYVSGPFICPKLPSSVHSTLGLIFGELDQYKYFNPPMVHVEDVARAHMFLLERCDLKGRYICSSEQVTLHNLSQFLAAKYPEMQIPKVDSSQNRKLPKLPVYSSKKLLDAGFNYEYGLDAMFDEAIQCCKEKGYI